MNGAGTFLLACFGKSDAELRSTLADPAKLAKAAEHHRIPTDWARWYIERELESSYRG